MKNHSRYQFSTPVKFTTQTKNKNLTTKSPSVTTSSDIVDDGSCMITKAIIGNLSETSSSISIVNDMNWKIGIKDALVYSFEFSNMVDAQHFISEIIDGLYIYENIEAPKTDPYPAKDYHFVNGDSVSILNIYSIIEISHNWEICLSQPESDMLDSDTTIVSIVNNQWVSSFLYP